MCRVASLFALLGALILVPVAGARASSLPAGFVGVNLDGPMWPTPAPGIDLADQFAAMERAGVEQVRVVFDWAAMQPYGAMRQVPALERGDYVDEGGIPTDFTQTDMLVGLAARYGIRLMPTVLYAPSWDSTRAPDGSIGRPARDAPYGRFLADLIHRYGPRGSFWRQHGPRVPIEDWQIWNEPDIRVFWPTQPWARSYVALLAAAHAAIHAADRSAKVVLAGLTNTSWRDLASIYAVPGARRDFDVVAIHPYTKTPSGAVEIVRFNRQVMDRNGGRRTPIVVDEAGWTSGAGHDVLDGAADVATTPRGQADQDSTLMRALAAQRGALGLIGFDIYTWASQPVNHGFTFTFAGLLSYAPPAGSRPGRLEPKPALYAFSRTALQIEGCRRKGARAWICIRR
jgi:hypothetical protein